MKEKELKILQNGILNSKEIILYSTNEIETYSNKIASLKNEYVITHPLDIDITKDTYNNLIKRDYILSCLESGGVDNWEWYIESYPSEESLNNLV